MKVIFFASKKLIPDRPRRALGTVTSPQSITMINDLPNTILVGPFSAHGFLQYTSVTGFAKRSISCRNLTF